MSSEVVFTERVPAGATVLQRNCDVLRTIANPSGRVNTVCVRIGLEIIWSHVLCGRDAIQLLGPVGIPVVKTQDHDTCVLCEHPVDVQCAKLPPDDRKALAQTEPVRSGDVVFASGEAHRMSTLAHTLP
jgi:hypothetical protein